MGLPVVLNVTICIPAKNERENLSELLLELDGALNHDLVGEAVVVIFDDGSADGTFEHFRHAEFSRFELRVLHSLVSVGKSAALQNAIDEALSGDSDVIVMMDGDCQDDPSHLPELIETLLNGHDVVNGRRFNREHSKFKQVSSRAFNGAVRQVSGLRLWDINSGYKAFSRSAAYALRPYFYGELHRVILVIAVWVGLAVGDVKVVNRPRRSGKSHYGFARGWRGLFDLVTIQFLRRYHARPGHFFSGIGSLLLIFATSVFFAYLASGQGMVTWFGHPIWPGLTFGSLALGGIFISLGFLAELIVFSSKGPSTSVLRSHDSYPVYPPLPKTAGLARSPGDLLHGRDN